MSAVQDAFASEKNAGVTGQSFGNGWSRPESRKAATQIVECMESGCCAMTPDKSVEFRLSAQTSSFTASGQKQLLPRGPVSTLAARAQAFMSTLEDGFSVL